VPVSTTYGPVVATSVPELSANVAGGAAVAQTDASMPGVLMMTADPESSPGRTFTDPSLAGVVGEPTSAGPEVGPPSSDEVVGGTEIEPAVHAETAPARRQSRIFLED